MATKSNGGGIGLVSYADKNRKPTRCLVCNLPDPLRLEIEAAKGVVSYRLMGEWLDEQHGIAGATRHKLERHFQDKHPRLETTA